MTASSVNGDRGAETEIALRQADSGEVLWSHTFRANLGALVIGAEDQIHVLERNCTLAVLNPSGELVSEFHTGHSLLLHPEASPEGQIFVTDHEGRAFALQTGPAGELPQTRQRGAVYTPQPWTYHINLGECDHGVYCDWDGDGIYTPGNDPVLLLDRDRDGQPGSDDRLGGLTDLAAADSDGDGLLTGDELTNFRLWYDWDGDGQLSAEDTVAPLVGDGFDKGKIEVDTAKMALASGGFCDH